MAIKQKMLPRLLAESMLCRDIAKSLEVETDTSQLILGELLAVFSTPPPRLLFPNPAKVGMGQQGQLASFASHLQLSGWNAVKRNRLLFSAAQFLVRKSKQTIPRRQVDTLGCKQQAQIDP